MKKVMKVGCQISIVKFFLHKIKTFEILLTSSLTQSLWEANHYCQKQLRVYSSPPQTNQLIIEIISLIQYIFQIIYIYRLITEMRKLTDLGSFQILKTNLTNIFVPMQVQKRINRWNGQLPLMEEEQKQLPIMKTMLYDFRREEALVQWAAVTDRDIGGDSQSAELMFNSSEPSIIMTGTIKTQDKDRLKNTPFVGLLQKKPFSFKVGIFNSFHIQLKTDGKPIQIQMVVYSPIYGFLFGRSFIVSKIKEWRTYQLPFRNIQILGEQAKQKQQLNDLKRVSVNSIMQTQLDRQRDLNLSGFAMRFPSAEDCERSISIRKIQLVRTMRGNQQYYKLYRRPYFYIVDGQQTRDHLLQTIDTGAFTTTLNIPPKLTKYL